MRTITIRLADYVDDDRRRRRRRATLVAVAAAAVALLAAGAFRTPPPPPPAPAPIVIVKTDTAAPLKPARAVVTPDAVTFKPQSIGGSSAAQFVTLRNDGEEPLPIRNVSLDGSRFQIISSCSDVLAGGASCTVAVLFAPPKPGQYRAKLLIDATVVLLSGDAVAPPVVDVDLGVIDFGRQMIGTKNARNVRFTNNSPAPIAVSGATAPPPFIVAQNGCATVAPGAGCDILVVFVPASQQAYDGELLVLDDQKNRVAHGKLTGGGYFRDGGVIPQIDPRRLRQLAPPTTTTRPPR